MFSVVAAVVAALPALAAEWMNDWAAATTRAAKEGKPLLVEFTGSDWCVPCNRLRTTVLESPDFELFVQDKFVLMVVDMPHKHPQPEALARQNRELCHRYGIEGFPTLMVISADGRLYGGFGGALLDVKTVCQRLETAMENGRMLEKADSLAGEERAHLLLEVYKRLPEGFRPASGLAAEILEADPGNSTGFQTELQEIQQWQEISLQLEEAGTDPVLHRKVVTAALKTAYPANRIKLEAMLCQLDFCDIYRQVEELADSPRKAVALLEAKEKVVPRAILGEVLALKAEMLIQAAESVQDIMIAKEAMEKSYLYQSPSAQYKAYQAKRFADPAALLARAKEQRRNRH